MNGYGAGGTAGYTGIGITGQDVLIYGNLLVTGGIDPTYLALTPQASGPQGFINPLWVDNSGNLRSENIKLEKIDCIFDIKDILELGVAGTVTSREGNLITGFNLREVSIQFKESGKVRPL